jgi:hypothetical protein
MSAPGKAGAIQPLRRRQFITLLGGATAFSALSANSRLVRAQAYPIQPVHLLVGLTSRRG